MIVKPKCDKELNFEVANGYARYHDSDVFLDWSTVTRNHDEMILRAIAAR